jgi:predicted acylesterase/phospholipase RssA
VIKAIQTVYYSKDTSKKSDFFKQVKQSYGSTAIFFSGGAGFGKFHMGVIKALVETDLMPKIIVGSSAGSMVAATICILKQHELEMLNHHQIIFGKETLGWKADNFWDGLQHIISDKPIGCDDVLKNFIRDHV